MVLGKRVLGSSIQSQRADANAAQLAQQVMQVFSVALGVEILNWPDEAGR